MTAQYHSARFYKPRSYFGFPHATLCIIPIFLIASLSLLTSGCEQRKEQTAPTSPPVVEATEVIQKDVPIYSEWVGTMEGLVNATIRAQVTGYLLKQYYQEGSFVKKGDMLFEIDPRPFKAALERAEGQLAQAKANLGKTEMDVKRFTPLAKESAISQQELDDAVQANLAAKAAVRSAEAAVEEAGLNLGFTRITSPIDGIAGTANAQIGDLVGPGQTGELTTVSTVDPIKVYFPISEQEYMAAARGISPSGENTRGLRDESLEMILADGTTYAHKGKFYYAGREVDVRTGTIRIAALFPNPGNILRPGQFCRIRAVTKVKKGALLIPQRAVVQIQGSYQVMVVNADNTVSIRPVKAGEQVDALWIIDDGLEPNDRVVVSGIQKVREGQAVTVKPYAPLAQDTAQSKHEAGPATVPTSR